MHFNHIRPTSKNRKEKMETFKDEIKNLKAITRVIAACVLANFVSVAQKIVLDIL